MNRRIYSVNHPVACENSCLCSLIYPQGLGLGFGVDEHPGSGCFLPVAVQFETDSSSGFGLSLGVDRSSIGTKKLNDSGADRY